MATRRRRVDGGIRIKCMTPTAHRNIQAMLRVRDVSEVSRDQCYRGSGSHTRALRPCSRVRV